MSRLLFPILLLLATVSVSLGVERPAIPWMGVMLQRPDAKSERPAEMGAGTGLLVEAVVENGPLAEIKGEAGDLWWKFDDQILVNMRQLLVLLSMKKVGDTVEIHYFRAGKLLKHSLKLGARPLKTDRPAQVAPVIAKSSSSQAQITEVAEMKNGSYELALSEREGSLNLLINKEGVTIFDGPVNSQEELEKLDPRWRASLLILRQALVTRAKPKRDEKNSRVRYLPKRSEE